MIRLKLTHYRSKAAQSMKVALLSLSGCMFLSTFTISSTFLLLFHSWQSPIFDSLCVPNIFYPPCTATTNRNLGISAACGLRAVLGSYTGGQHCACSWRSNQAGQVPNGEVEPQATLTEPAPPPPDRPSFPLHRATLVSSRPIKFKKKRQNVKLGFLYSTLKITDPNEEE